MKKYKALEEDKMQEQTKETRRTKIKRPFAVNEHLISRLNVSKDLFANIGQTQIGEVQHIFYINHIVEKLSSHDRGCLVTLRHGDLIETGNIVPRSSDWDKYY